MRLGRLLCDRCWRQVSREPQGRVLRRYFARVEHDVIQGDRQPGDPEPVGILNAAAAEEANG
jgi:hypothetical protein